MITAGIDIGSRTTKIVIMNEGVTASRYIEPTGWNPLNAAESCFRNGLERAGLARKDICKITATGYGRVMLPFADDTLTEITCHAKGAHFTDPEIRTIIDIGGQDSKVIALDQFGFVEDFAMNDRCAAGTGKFLEFLAHSLNINVSEFGKIAVQSQSPATISSMCTVFAESEVLSLVAERVPVPDIISGIHYSIARRMESMLNSVGYREKVALSGGVAKNHGIKKQLFDLLRVPVTVPNNPEYIGALGAALAGINNP